MTEYSAGFMFDYERVALIVKERPAWQKGKLNGIGGHIEPGESPLAAMVREFKEETGLDTCRTQWKQFCVLNGAGFRVYFFATIGSTYGIQSLTDELVQVVPVGNISRHNAIPNLTWLIPAARLALLEGGPVLHVEEMN